MIRMESRSKGELNGKVSLEDRRDDWPNVKSRLMEILAKISSEQCQEIEILLSEPSLDLLTLIDCS
jgi:hypothetical protein